MIYFVFVYGRLVLTTLDSYDAAAEAEKDGGKIVTVRPESIEEVEKAYRYR